MKAFPNGIITNSDGLIVGGQQGMDLRDYFAAAALVSVTHLNHQKDIARAAYAIADAMMEARK